MPEHLLDRTQVGAALEQVGRERVAQQVRVDARRLEAGLLGQPAEDQERSRACERAAAGVEEQAPADGGASRYGRPRDR